MTDGWIKHVVVIKYALDSDLINRTYAELTHQFPFKRTVVRSVPEMLALSTCGECVDALWLDIHILIDLKAGTKKSFKEIINGILFAVECNTGCQPKVGVQFQNPEHLPQKQNRTCYQDFQFILTT